jgi:hypothetical protein
MVWETTLNCFASGGWNGIPCMLSQGFLNMAGTQLIAGLAIMGLFFYLSFRMRLPWSFTLTASVAFIAIMTMKYLNAWIGWLVLIIALFVAGYGFYKFWKGRG